MDGRLVLFICGCLDMRVIGKLFDLNKINKMHIELSLITVFLKRNEPRQT